MLSKARVGEDSKISEADLIALAELAIAASRARGIIEQPDPKKQEQPLWHDEARVVEWHIRYILAEAGHPARVGSGENSPLPKIIAAALLAANCSERVIPTETIRKALKKMSKKAARPTPFDEVNKGFCIVA